jgi:glycosyltransferase involved in cell wall biosynthesis
VFILPSFSENFGIVVAEALAQGVPVIATDGSPWESLASERCGWSVGTSAAAIAGALAAAMVLPAAERRAMGVRGHAYVQRAFGWNGIAAQTLEFYDWLLSGGAVPDFVDRR